MPVGFFAANLTTVVTPATNTSYFQYMGRATKVSTSVKVEFRVTTAAATITWAEVGVFKGPVVIGAAASLTRLGYQNVAAVVNSTGIKTVTITCSGMAIEDDLWIAYGDQASTLMQLRAGLADDIQSGYFQTYAGRISTAGVPQATVLAGATVALAWCSMQLT
jgi:hypothetical protein